MDGQFFGIQFSGVELEQTTLDTLKDNFIKFLPEDAPGELGNLLEPEYMKKQYEKLGLDKENPSMYNMVCWMTEQYKESTSGGISFEQFIEMAVYFFS